MFLFSSEDFHSGSEALTPGSSDENLYLSQSLTEHLSQGGRVSTA